VTVGVGITNAAQIDAGFTHSCIVRGDGSVACFGSNVFGELGNGSTLATGGAGPVAVVGL
jgi:alpha-tubulin suppressor-like RCC1 family protein